jgi:hypothetical protein
MYGIIQSVLIVTQISLLMDTQAQKTGSAILAKADSTVMTGA